MFQVVSIALMTSWVLSMIQTPAFCLKLLKPPEKGFYGESNTSLIHGLYGRMLNISLRYRPITFVVMVGLLVAGMKRRDRREFVRLWRKERLEIVRARIACKTPPSPG